MVVLSCVLIFAGYFAGRISKSGVVATAAISDDVEDSRRTHRGRKLSKREYRESPAHPSNLRKEGGIEAGMAYVLDENDPVQRTLKIHQLLESINADNWQELVEGMIRSNGETGRNADYHLRAILIRIGQVDGQRALEEGVGIKTGKDARGELLYGWAMKDPHGAWAWAKRFNEENPDRKIGIYGSAFGGLTRTNPEMATRLLQEMPDEEWSMAIGGYIRNLIRSETLDRTDEWLEDVMASERPEALKRSAIWTISKTVGQTARNLRAPEKIAQWYDDFGQAADSEDRRMAVDFIHKSGQRDGANAAQLLDQFSKRSLILDENHLIQIRERMPKERRAEAHEWLVNNGQADLATWFTE